MTSDISPLSLNVPEPGCRPGSTPDFSDFEIPRAGAVPRPPVDVDPDEIRDMAFSIVRVLNKDGEAVGEWAGALSTEELHEGLRHMLLLRTFDARMLNAQRQGKTSFYMQHLGEEAVSCAFSRALQPGDMNFPTYRQAGLLIARGYPMVTMMNQIYSNAEDPLHGRQLPILYSSKEHGFFTVSGNLGTQFIQSVGWAMASAISGDTKIAAGWIGDGSTAESDFHAAMVFASTYNAPVVLSFALAAVAVHLLGDGLKQYFVMRPRLDGMADFFALFSHILGHGNWDHLLSNFMLILLVGPILEERHGSTSLLSMILITALVTSILNLLFFKTYVLGASGIAFMFILLASTANIKHREIPLTFIAIAVLYLGGELVNAFSEDQISQMAHIVGGIAGAAFGFLGAAAPKKAASPTINLK